MTTRPFEKPSRAPAPRAPLRGSAVRTLARGTRFTRDLRVLGLVDSTLNVVADLARRGAEDGLAVVADGQTAGRGRRGGAWFSAPGNGLYVAVLSRPAPSAIDAPLFAGAVGLAAAAAVAETTGLDAKLKWPNDVWCDGAKVGGVLVESVSGADGYAIVGVGITMRTPPEGAIVPGVVPARGLADLAATRPSRERLLSALFDALETRLAAVRAAPDRIRSEYRDRDALVGRTVAVETPEGVLRGVVRSADLIDGIEVERADGVRKRVRAAFAHVAEVS